MCMCVSVFTCLWCLFDDNNARVWFLYVFLCVLELSRRTASCAFCGQLASGLLATCIVFCVAISMISGAVLCLSCTCC